MYIRIDIPAIVLGIIVLVFSLLFANTPTYKVEGDSFPISSICRTNEILEDRDGVWWCVEPKVTQGVIEDPNWHLVERSNLGDLYRC